MNETYIYKHVLRQFGYRGQQAHTVDVFRLITRNFQLRQDIDYINVT